MAPGLPSIFKNLSGSPDQGIFLPQIVWIGYLGTQNWPGHSQTMLRASQSLENGFRSRKNVYFGNEHCYRCSNLPTALLFWEFHGCSEFLLTIQKSTSSRLKLTALRNKTLTLHLHHWDCWDCSVMVICLDTDLRFFDPQPICPDPRPGYFLISTTFCLDC